MRTGAEQASRSKARPWLIAAGVVAGMFGLWVGLHLVAGPVGLVLFPETPAPATELFAGLPGDYDAGQKLLTARLDERFPPGGPAHDLERYLLAQGLHPSPAAVAGEQNVTAIWGRSVCGRRLDISWKADEQARLVSHRVVYWNSGCL